jgi:hypothetical protein
MHLGYPWHNCNRSALLIHNTAKEPLVLKSKSLVMRLRRTMHLHGLGIFTHVLFTILIALSVACASGWNDFSNNLATDLAPFLSLFG